MKVTMNYFAQVRKAAGVPSEQLELVEGADTLAAIRTAADRHGEDFRALVLTEKDQARAGLLILVNSVPAPPGTRRDLREGDEVAVFTPVSGG